MTSAIIECENLKKSYLMGDTQVHALDGIDLIIHPGEFVAVMGPSGSGKSTLMHVLGLLDVPDHGRYRLNGSDISALSGDELADFRARTIGFVFQQFNLLPRMSALENAALPLIYLNGHALSDIPAEMLTRVGLQDRMHHQPNELSGGQQQRVAIARSLVNQPSVIFADEPTGNLDSRSQEEIMGYFEQLNRDGITIVLVTHEEDVARRARRVIRMLDGKIIDDQMRVAVGANEAAGTGEAVPRPCGSRSRFHAVLDEFKSHLLQAFRSLGSNKVRTCLSVLGILIGVAAVIAMLALGQGAKQSIESRLTRLGTNLLAVRQFSRSSGAVSGGATAVARFTREDARAIAEEIPGIKRVTAGVDNRGQVEYGNKNWATEIMGTTPEYAPMRNSVPIVGRFLNEEEDRMRARVAVVGMTLVRELFGGMNPIGEYIKINRVNFQVIGVLPERGASAWRDQDDVVIIPLTTAMRRVFGEEFIEDIDVEVESTDRMEEVEDAIRRLIIQRHRLPPSYYDTIRIHNMADIQEALTETSRTMAFLLSSIAAISLLVGGIGIMNIMLVSVTERTREIGLRKAIGAKRRDILWQFLIEAVVISVGGGLTGILLGWLITLAMAQFAGWAVSVSAASVVMAFGFSAVIGIVFGLWPARKAAALNPIDALRYE